MRCFVLFLAVFPIHFVLANEVLNTIFLILTFGLGGLINNCIAGPKCDEGLDHLGLSDQNCGCIADVESGPLFCVKGVASCSSGVFCIQDDLCGDAKMSMTFGDNGDLDRGTELYSYFLTTIPDVYEIRIVAQPKNDDVTASNTFESCSAAIDGTGCQNCSICPDGISFTFDCSDAIASGPVVDDCLNFMFEKAV